MCRSERVEVLTQPEQLSTILPDDTLVAIECLRCGQESEFALGYLKQLPVIECRVCGQGRHFNRTELGITRRLLARMGYRFGH